MGEIGRSAISKTCSTQCTPTFSLVILSAQWTNGSTTITLLTANLLTPLRFSAMSTRRTHSTSVRPVAQWSSHQQVEALPPSLIRQAGEFNWIWVRLAPRVIVPLETRRRATSVVGFREGSTTLRAPQIRRNVEQGNRRRRQVVPRHPSSYSTTVFAEIAASFEALRSEDLIHFTLCQVRVVFCHTQAFVGYSRQAVMCLFGCSLNLVSSSKAVACLLTTHMYVVGHSRLANPLYDFVSGVPYTSPDCAIPYACFASERLLC